MAFDDQNEFDFDEKVISSTKEKTKPILSPIKKRGPKKSILNQIESPLQAVLQVDDIKEDEDLSGACIQNGDAESATDCVMPVDDVLFVNDNTVSKQDTALVPSNETKPIPLQYDKYRCSWIATKTRGKRPARLSKNYLEWPKSSTTHCWWCCHPFDTVPIPLPTCYNDNIDAFSVKGTFCSWGCSKSYSLGESHTLGYQSQLLLLLRKRVEGKVIPIKCAPQRSQLSIFGGPMSIEAFRRASATECKQSMLTVNMLAQTFGLMMIKNENQDHENTHEPSSMLSRERGLKSDLGLDNISIKKNEPLKLKRTKPSPATKGKTVLERVLGISS